MSRHSGGKSARRSPGARKLRLLEQWLAHRYLETLTGRELTCFGLSTDAFRQQFLASAATDGFSVLPPPRLVDPRVTPHPLAAFLQGIRLEKPPARVKRGFVYLSGWPETPFTSTYERLRAAPEWRTFELPVGHNVIALAFDELLEIASQFA